MQLEIISRVPSSVPRPTPLLFVHGAWSAAWYWDEYFLPYFARQGYAAHAVSLRGHGRSAGRQQVRWTRLAAYVGDVAEAAQQLPCAPVLIGHSMGGWIVQKYLEQHCAAAAVLLAPLSPAGALGFTLDAVRRFPLDALRTLLTGEIGSQTAARRLFFSPTMPDCQAGTYAAQMGAESSLLLGDVLRERLCSLAGRDIPLLVLGALDDAVFAVPQVQAVANLHGAQVEFFPHTAHTMMLERNWQRVADRMLAWLRERGI